MSIFGSRKKYLPPALLAAFALTLAFTPPALAGAAFPGSSFVRLGELVLPDLPFSFAIPEAPAGQAVYLLGGSDHTGAGTRVVRRYSLSADSWQVVADALPYAWYNNERHGAAVASNGKIYLGPGNGPGGWGQHDRIIELDPATGVAVERAPILGPGSLVWGVAVAPAPASRGGVYLLGGWNGGGISQVRHYDPATDQSTLIGNLSVARTVGARVSHPNGRIYLFGGNTLGSLTAIDVLDTASESVRAVANPLLFGFIHGTQAWTGPDGLIYLWNPTASFLGSSSDRIIRFDPATETFESLGDTPLPAGLPMSAFADLEHQRVLFFGLTLPGYVWGESGVTVGEVWSLSSLAPNQDPVADAGADQLLSADAACRATARLDGSASSDPDGDALSFLWTTPNGTAATPKADLTLTLGEHLAHLRVEDGRGGVSNDEVTIRVVDTTAPAVALRGDMLVQVQCAAPFVDPGATASDNCDPSPLVVSTGAVDTQRPGSYVLSYEARDRSGNASARIARTVKVVDTIPPVVAAVSPAPAVLWPPNHRMVPVTVTATAGDSCSAAPACTIIAVASNESAGSGGSGNTSPDWQITGASQVLLRAERSGSGSGRTYTLTLSCSDPAGNTSTGYATVHVPKSQSGG